MLKYRSDYQSPSCNVNSARLDIAIFDDRALVTTTLELERVSDAPFLLNGRDLTLHQISINDRLLDEADWPVSADGITLKGCQTRPLCGWCRNVILRQTQRWKGCICLAVCTVPSVNQKGSVALDFFQTALTS